MARRRLDGDLRIGMMLRAYDSILRSVPTEQQPGEHGPLSADEIDRASQWMAETTAEIQAERDSGDT